MPWVVIHIDSHQADCEALEQALIAAGAAAVTLQDSANQALFEPHPGESPLWDRVCVSGLYDATTRMETVIAALGDQPGLSSGQYRLEILEDKDWVRSWMDNYHPIPISSRLWICPSWINPPDPAAINLRLDPGLAFGTGTHPTTALCLSWLDQHEPAGKSLIDFGCGSGILAIAGLLLGADHAIGTDIDPQALVATKENAERNGVNPESLRLCHPEHLSAAIRVDILLANILAGPLAKLAPTLTALVKPGGSLVLSGLLPEQVQELTCCYREFDFEPAQTRDEWVLLSATKRTSPDAGRKSDPVLRPDRDS